jgi:hypothetical protein
MDLGQQVEQRLVHGPSRHPPAPEGPGTLAARASESWGGEGSEPWRLGFPSESGGVEEEGARDWEFGIGACSRG